MAKAKQETTEVIGSQRGKNRDSFGLQRLSMKMFEAKTARVKAMSKPETTTEEV